MIKPSDIHPTETAMVIFPCPRDLIPDIPRILEASASDNIALEMPVNLPNLIERIYDLYVQRALQQANGNIAKAAKLLGLNRTTLNQRLRRQRKTAP